MKKRNLLILLLCTAFNCFVQAATSCPAPAPQSGGIMEYGTTTADVSWSAVPGIASYHVVATDINSGVIASDNIVQNTSFSFHDLEAGTTYDIAISASYCDEGPYGTPLRLSLNTDVVIVDIILQTECLDDVEVTQTTVAAGDEMVLELNRSTGGCYQIHAETTSLEDNIEFDLAVKTGNNGLINLGNFASNPNDLSITGNGPVWGKLLSGGNNTPGPVFRLNTLNNGNSSPNVQVKWFVDVDLTIVYCPDCSFISDDGRKFQAEDEHTDLAQTIKVHPNPVKDLLHLHIPTSGQLDVWDFTGRRRYQQNFAEPQMNQSINVQNWPSGTYIIRWYALDAPPEVQYFLKH